MKILNIIKFDLIKMTREKGILILTFLMPVMLILIFGNLNFGDGNNPKVPIGITNQDNSAVSKDLVNEVKKDKTVLVNDLKEEDLFKQVKNSDIYVGFIIPSDFNEKIEKGLKPEIKVIKLPSASDYAIIQGIIYTAYAKLGAKDSVIKYFDEKIKNLSADNKAIIISGIGNKVEEYLQKPPLVSIDSGIYKQKGVKKVDQKTTYTLSFSVVFVMWAVVFAAGEILLERKTNTWGRLNISPTSKATIFLGKIIGTFVRGWVQVVFLIVFSKLVMGIDWGNSILITFIVVSVFLLCITSFGMLLSSMVKTFAQLAAMSAIVITCSSMLAGCYWPLEIMPDGMQKIARIFPQYWAMKGLNANLENLGLDAIVAPVTILAGMCILFYLVNIIISKLKIKTIKASPVIEAMQNMV